MNRMIAYINSFRYDVKRQRNLLIAINVVFAFIFLMTSVTNNKQNYVSLIKVSTPSSEQTNKLAKELPKLELATETTDATQSHSAASSPICLPQVELMGPGRKYQISKHLRRNVIPDFNTGHHVLYNKPSTSNIYEEFQNCGKRSPNAGYYHTNINQSFADFIVKTLKPRFMLEVGSFTGVSSVIFGNAIVNNNMRGQAWLLCIDTWLGDLNMFLNKKDFAMSLTWRAGQPEVYDQWMVHVIDSKLTDVILPMRQTSILGARFLKAVMWVADFIYLDSAHEVDETFNELVLYWDRLRPGGWLMGDDYVWRAVRHDVMKFVTLFGLHLNRPSELLWYIEKPMDFRWPRKLFHKSFGYYNEEKNVFQNLAKQARYKALLNKEREEALAEP